MARQILLLQVVVVLVLVVTALALAAVDARQDTHEQARSQALVVARSLADSPTVRAAVSAPDPTSVLQPYAEEVRADTSTDFVVVMDLDRIRFTHPDPDRIGERFVGDVGDAPRGGTLTQVYTGTLGPSVRAVVPVESAGRVVAMVAVGITIDRIDRRLIGELPVIGSAALATLAVGLLGAWLIARRLRRQTHGLGEQEISRMYDYYRAVLRAVREGLLLLDDDDRVQLVNDEAVRLLDLPDDVVGRSVHSLDLPPALVSALVGQSAEPDLSYVVAGRALVVSTAPAYSDGAGVGAVVTIRDRTELQTVTGELDLVRDLTESLRAQNHEAANRLHTVVSLVEMGRTTQAVDFATADLAAAQGLTDAVVAAVEEPVLAALLLGKSAQAAERGIELVIEGGVEADVPLGPRDLVTVVGNLVDNALDAVSGAEARARRVEVRLSGDRHELVVEVDDAGPGVPADAVDRVLERGWSTKADDGHGLGLTIVAQTVTAHGGTIEVGRAPLGGARFTVEVPGVAR